MSLNFTTDTSTQLNYSNFAFATPQLDNYATSNQLINVSNILKGFIDTKQSILTSATNLLGIGSAISALDYNKITLNKPTYFNTDWNTTITNKPTYFNTDWNSTIANKPTYFNTDWNTTIINKPTYFNSDWATTVINKPDLTPYVSSNVLTNYLSTYTNTTGMNTAISTALGSYTNTTGMNTAILIGNNNTSNYISTKFLGLIGGSLSGSLNGTTINASTNLQENSINLASKYLQLDGTNNITSLLNINAADNTTGGTKGIIFRAGYNTTLLNYNCSILTYDHDGQGFCDGLSINGWDGVSFCTGLNTRNERMRIDKDGNVNIGSTGQAYKLYVNGNSYLNGNSSVNGTITATTFSGSGASLTSIPFTALTGTSPYVLKTGDSMSGDLSISKTGARLTLIGGGGTGATARFDLSTYNHGTTEPSCSFITTDNGTYSSSLNIKIKTAGNGGLNSQFSALFIKPDGNVGIGSENPNYKLDVNGSLNSTSLYQNGTLINFSSYATTSQLTSYSTTGTDGSYLLKTGGVMSGQITGVTTLNATTVISSILSTTNNGNTAAPSVGVYGGIGDRLVLWVGAGAIYPYSLGIDNNTLWYSVPISASHKFYYNGSLVTTISSTGLSTTGLSTTGQLQISASTYNGLYITNTNAADIVSIELKNNTTYSGFIGIGCTAYTGNYKNNLFIQSPQSLILNTNGNVTSATPNFIINTSGNVGLATTNPTCRLSLGTPVGYKVLSLWDNTTPNDFQFVGFGNYGGLCLNTNNNTTDAIQFRAGASATTANELMRINGNGSVCIGTASAISTNTKLTISGTSTAASQPIVRIEQLGGWDGSAKNYAFQVSGYSDLGGIRINGTDTYNTIFTTGNNDMGLSTNAGVIRFLTNSGNERMKIANNGNVGIGNLSADAGKLCIGSSLYSEGVSDGTLVISKNNAVNANRSFKFGYDANYNFCMGDNLGNGTYTWRSTDFNMRYSDGNVGIGTAANSTNKLNVNGSLKTSSIYIGDYTIYRNLFSSSGFNHETLDNFNNVGDFGYRYINGLGGPAVNGPGTPDGVFGQYYSWFIGLGAEYNYDSYGAQFALPRNISNPVLSIRYREGGGWGSWSGITASALSSTNVSIPTSTTSTGIINLALGGTSGADDNTNMKILMYGVNSGSGGVSGSIVIRAYNDIKFFSNGQGTTPNLFIDGIYGLVGIGGITPVAKLHVASGTYTSGWLGYIGLVNSGGVSVVYWGNTFGSICAVFESNLWCKSNIMSSSDIRIKKDIEDIDDTTALDKILSIQPKTYKYKDTLLKRDNKVIGFIAQQIKEVIPEAVELIPEYIPNIYKISTTNDDIVNLDNTELLNVDDKIKIIDNSGKIEETKILEVNETSIKIDKTFNNEDVFVYGSKVDDFHSLDKSYIYTLNVCATQQLYKLIQLQEERIRILEEKLASF